MERFNDHLAEIAVAAIEITARPAKWSDLCDVIANMLGTRAFVVMAYDLQHHRSPLVHCSARLRTPKATELIDKLSKGETSEDNQGYSAVGKTQAGHVLSEREVYGIPPNYPLPPNTYRESVLTLLDAQRRFAMRLNDIGPFLDCAISLEQGEDPENSNLSECSGFLTRVLSKTMEASRVISNLSVTYSRMLTLFDGLAFAAVFCDRRGSILHANRTFKDMAKDCDGIVVEGNTVKGSNAKGTLDTHSAIRAALSPTGSTRTQMFTLGRRSGGLPLVGYASAIRDAEFKDSTVALLIVLDPLSETRISGEGLAAFGVLSPAELHVSDLLVRGLSTQEIADHRQTSEETTRGQIKTSLTKLLCRSRLDMVRLALTSKTPLTGNAGDPPGPGCGSR